jgi:hypothetical protein
LGGCPARLLEAAPRGGDLSFRDMRKKPLFTAPIVNPQTSSHQQPTRATLRAEANEFVPSEKARVESPVMEEPDEPWPATMRRRRLEMV